MAGLLEQIRAIKEMEESKEITEKMEEKQKTVKDLLVEKYGKSTFVKSEKVADLNDFYAPRLYSDIAEKVKDGYLIPLARYEVYNELYSYRGVRVRLPSGLYEVKPFPVAIVEIYKQALNPNNFYVVIPVSDIIRMNPEVARIETSIKDTIRGYITDIIDSISHYSDHDRIKVFTDVFKYIMNLHKEGRLGKVPTNYLVKNLPRIIDDVLRDTEDLGFGKIEYLFYDDQIEDIFINSGISGNIYAQTRDFYYVITNIEITKSEVNRFKSMVLKLYGKSFDEKHPVVDVQIEGYFNIRVNMTFGGDEGVRGFSVDGTSITLRKAKEIPPSIAILTSPKYRSINEEVGAILMEFFHRGVSSLIYGETGSGKTTVLKTLLMTVPRHYRIVSLEDTVEMPKMSDWGYHHVRLSARSPLSKVDESDWDMEKGSKNLLRMRPYVVVLGEVRSYEAKTLFEIAQMGVATVYSTMHARNHREVLNRLVHHMGVEPSAVPSIETLTLMSTFRPYGTSKIIRRLSSIAFLSVPEDEKKETVVTLSSGEETVNVKINRFIDYHYKVNLATREIEEKWEINWENFIKSPIMEKIVNNYGMDVPLVLTEITEKYNLIRALKDGVIYTDFEDEMNRILKYLDIYYTLNSSGYFGEELWKKFKEEMKYHYNIEVKHEWDDWILKKIPAKF